MLSALRLSGTTTGFWTMSALALPCEDCVLVVDVLSLVLVCWRGGIGAGAGISSCVMVLVLVCLLTDCCFDFCVFA